MSVFKNYKGAGVCAVMKSNPSVFVSIKFIDRTYTVERPVLSEIHLFKKILEPSPQFKDAEPSSHVEYDTDGTPTAIHLNFLDEGRFGIMLKQTGNALPLDVAILGHSVKPLETPDYIGNAIADQLISLYNQWPSRYFYKTGDNNGNDHRTVVMMDVRIMADMPHIPEIDLTISVDKRLLLCMTETTWNVLTNDQTRETVDIHGNSSQTKKIAFKSVYFTCKLTIRGTVSVKRAILECEWVTTKGIKRKK